MQIKSIQKELWGESCRLAKLRLWPKKWVRQLVKHLVAWLIILRSHVHDAITFYSLVNFESNLGQMIFDISLTKCKRNEIKRVRELKIERVESRCHDKVLNKYRTRENEHTRWNTRCILMLHSQMAFNNWMIWKTYYNFHNQRFQNWDHKHDPILKLRDENICKFKKIII